MHVINVRHFHGGATAGNRTWSPPNRHDVMTGRFGRRDDSLEAGLRMDWLDAVQRVTGFDPRDLGPHGVDRNRRRSRAIEHAGGPGPSGGGTGRAQAPRSRRAEEQGGHWVRDTHPRFEERDGRTDGDASRLGFPAEDGTAVRMRDHGIDREPDAPSGHPRGAGGEVPGLGDEYRGNRGGPHEIEGHPRAREPGDGDDERAPLRDGASGDRDGGNDDDGGDGGPARGGGRIANLVPESRGRGPANGRRPVARKPSDPRRRSLALRTAPRRLGTTRGRRGRMLRQAGRTRTRTIPRRTPRSRTQARGDGGGGAPARGRAAPRTADGGTGTGGTTTTTRGPGGTVAGKDRGSGATAATAVPTGCARSPPSPRRRSAGISPGRSGSMSSSLTPLTPPTPSFGLPALGRGGCAAPSSPTRRWGRPSTG